MDPTLISGCELLALGIFLEESRIMGFYLIQTLCADTGTLYLEPGPQPYFSSVQGMQIQGQSTECPRGRQIIIELRASWGY